MVGHVPYTTLGEAIFTHPMIAEGITGLLSHVPAEVTRR